MSSSVPVQQGGGVMVTQMYPTPAQGGVVCNQIPQQMCTGRSSFVRAHPLALGTVQIMIGLLVFLSGVVSVVGADSLSVSSSIFVWGAGIYITAGSLTVAAGKSSNRCLMNATLAFNVSATVAACAAVILNVNDAVGMHCYNHDYDYDCYRYQTNQQGMSGVLAVFNFLEFIITIVILAFACKSTRSSCNKQQPSVYVVPGNASMAPQAQPSYSLAPATVVQLPSQGLPTYPAASTSMAHPPPQMMNVFNPVNGQSFPGLADPPGYTEEKKSF